MKAYCVFFFTFLSNSLSFGVLYCTCVYTYEKWIFSTSLNADWLTERIVCLWHNIYFMFHQQFSTKVFLFIVEFEWQIIEMFDNDTLCHFCMPIAYALTETKTWNRRSCYNWVGGCCGWWRLGWLRSSWGIFLTYIASFSIQICMILELTSANSHLNQLIRYPPSQFNYVSHFDIFVKPLLLFQFSLSMHDYRKERVIQFPNCPNCLFDGIIIIPSASGSLFYR